MKRITIVSMLAVVALGLIATAAPKIQADDAIYDFGEVLEGIAVVHTFILSNIGNETLDISKVRTSCGCTTTALSKSSLSPGESVEFKATLNTSGYSGNIGKSIYVESNDPETPKLTLRMIGKVKRAQPYNITASDLNYLFYLLIDVRELEAYSAGHLMGAINIPFAELGNWISRLPNGVLIILYDQDGSLSDQAAQNLQSAGFLEAQSLLGGLNEWERQFKDKYFLSSSAE